jgi:hypothetical protein
LSFYRYAPDPPEPVADPADLPPAFFIGGDWELSAPGSAQVPAFELPLNLPPPIEVTNFADVTVIDRSEGQIVVWNPVGYADGELMHIRLYGPLGASTLISCEVPAADGMVTIPAELLEQMDAAEATGGPAPALHLSLGGAPKEEDRFSIQLTDGEIVPGRIGRGAAVSLPVSLR